MTNAVQASTASAIFANVREARVAVFVSGEGSNLQAILDYASQCPSWHVEVGLVVSDKPWSRAVRRAIDAKTPVFSADPKAFPSRSAYERAILRELRAHRVDGIALAGYMRIVGPDILEAYPNRILNLHPSLLPAFPGRSAIADALSAGVTETGVTVHYVDAGVDTGPIIAQWRVPVTEGMELGALTQRVHEVEHHLYPAVIGQVAPSWLSE